MYSSGRLVPESQRQSFPGLLIVDPDRLPTAQPEPERLTGRWLYGGHWMVHFGHFLLESLSALWPEPDPTLSGLVFHIWPADYHAIEPLQWQSWLVTQAGWDLPIRIVGHEPVVADQLIVPTRAFHLNIGALPELVTLWDRIAPLRTPETTVFLSRSRLTADPRRLVGDERLDEELSSLGCEIVHPQELSMDQQVETVARASTLVGTGGSHLHLSMFARTCTKVIEIGDLRMPDRPVHDQVNIATARGHHHDFVPLIRDG
ncbi:MAG: glycosyltransferase family 61 protein, partial [Ilumatobacteraceae bacterium]